MTPDLLAVQLERVRRKCLAASPFPVGGVAAGKHDDVIVTDQRPLPLEVADDVGAAAGGEGEVAR